MAGSILLVDTDPDSVAIYSLILEFHGYRVTVADDAEDAFQIAVACQPDLVISDLFVPDDEEPSFLQSLRQDQRTDKTPVIVLDSSRRFDFLGLLSNGPTARLLKPCEPSRLLEEVNRILKLDVSVEMA